VSAEPVLNTDVMHRQIPRRVKRYYYQNPCVYKLVQLLSSNNVKDLRNIGKLISTAKKRRDSLSHSYNP